MDNLVTGFLGGLIIASAVWLPIMRAARKRAWDDGWFTAGKLAIKIKDRERAQREVTVQSSGDLAPSLDSKTD